MKIAMHSNDLCARGVPISVFQYSSYLKKIFNHEIICLYDETSPFNDEIGISRFHKNFRTYGYTNWTEVEDILKEESVDLLYMQKMGNFDGKIARNIPTVIHSVFQAHEPHGAVYAYISEWLSEVMPGSHDFVPYIVEMDKSDSDLRSELGIPNDALVFGRYGAYNQFDLDYVHQCVYDVACQHDDIYFLFMNTNVFCEPIKNIIHLPKSIEDKVKSSFINTCDCMLHARARGESFGLAIAEFLFHDKPVIAYSGGTDKNHIYMMGEKGLWYEDYLSLKNIILDFDRLPEGEYKSIVNSFNAEDVMVKFGDVFLKEFS
jgi:hypothetical protein